MRSASEFAEQALAGSGSCALARPWSSRYGVGARRLCDHWRPPVYSAGYLSRVSHVGGPAVRGCDDLAVRSAFVVSFFPEDLLEAANEGAEDEVLCLAAGSRSS
ncbi:hypothetical protein BHM03_00060323 [Ensete ventricosum]|nr:hypothetical protein BHM03_00060323 [Ensete ventricosum]